MRLHHRANVFHLQVFVSHEHPRAEVVAVEAQGPAEVEDRLLMFAVGGLVVADDAASLRVVFVSAHRLVRQAVEFRGFVLAVENVGVYVHLFKAAQVRRKQAFEVTLRRIEIAYVVVRHGRLLAGSASWEIAA